MKHSKERKKDIKKSRQPIQKKKVKLQQKKSAFRSSMFVGFVQTPRLELYYTRDVLYVPYTMQNSRHRTMPSLERNLSSKRRLKRTRGNLERAILSIP